MATKAVLICRPNSYPFVDRTLSLEQPVKIGRAMERATQSNGLFHSPVLSRNHALIWYDNGKFYLKDTKSHNGTFVNDQRLSRPREESLPREVSSGDIVRFGVDVFEKERKVTRQCVVADLKLYLPDGKEAKASGPPSTSTLSGSASVSLADLYQLNQHIQEALQREQMLQSKLKSLQLLVKSLYEAADDGWQALIAEDRLLSRVDTLENQLQTYVKNFSDDELREELRKLQEDKIVYQELAKERLQRVVEQKTEAVRDCLYVEGALMDLEEECASYEEMIFCNDKERRELALNCDAQILKTVELQNKLQDTEEQHKETVARLKAENKKLNNEVNRLLANEAVMREKIQQLKASGDRAAVTGDPDPFQIPRIWLCRN